MVNLPTQITLSRLLGIPIIFYCLSQPSLSFQWAGLIFFLIVAATDWLDGYLARKLDQVTDLGKFLDPLVDKLLIFAPLLVLVERGTIPAWAVFLILGREIAIAGWRVTPNLSGEQVSGANQLGKIKTALQIIAITALIAPINADNWLIFSQILFSLAVFVTLFSGLIYVWNPLLSKETNS
ncbi:CDP-diacylglycerol--glycerol-3-phosphate 3-phosphatidyltransferase [Euhalothece natronophila Z-M001]|uniref:CDP-diacylglycerol--glycerol-3-phosphate 3-phosphatidyltransferase n=1 Tax=Euhalothece natronophila Z-M001 TaxID=522448 RepID=A0A5B8NHU1_9CHRO|nr:CDP-diacylglycerol--glycerol-3-phosphate 3-phosphatidyltransferase [Euhalothece natronophila]QDZ38762.1 CDP-diacylglycerol--glycerol-3-phosphate 3-phosphatidyltransferase [Euhalothece natronophila Z-M001]